MCTAVDEKGITHIDDLAMWWLHWKHDSVDKIVCLRLHVTRPLLSVTTNVTVILQFWIWTSLASLPSFTRKLCHVLLLLCPFFSISSLLLPLLLAPVLLSMSTGTFLLSILMEKTIMLVCRRAGTQVTSLGISFLLIDSCSSANPTDITTQGRP